MIAVVIGVALVFVAFWFRVSVSVVSNEVPLVIVLVENVV